MSLSLINKQKNGKKHAFGPLTTGIVARKIYLLRYFVFVLTIVINIAEGDLMLWGLQDVDFAQILPKKFPRVYGCTTAPMAVVINAVL